MTRTSLDIAGVATWRCIVRICSTSRQSCSSAPIHSCAARAYHPVFAIRRDSSCTPCRCRRDRAGCVRPATSQSVGPPRSKILEARVLPEESQAHGADRPVALLADDDLGDALVLRVLVVHLVAIDEENHVCILLNRSRVMTDDAVGEP